MSPVAAPPDEGLRSVGRDSAWLLPATELDVYEGLRGGDEVAFRLIAGTMQPVLFRLAGITTSSSDVARTLIADNWKASLRALGRFNWNCPLATWIAAGLVRRARSRVPRDRPQRQQLRPSPRPLEVRPPGPLDWSDLPWSSRWDEALPLLARTYADLPLANREVIHAHDVEQWPLQRGCDVLGVTAARYQRLRALGHERLHDALAALVGDDTSGPWRSARMARIGVTMRILPGRADEEPDRLDERSLAVFRSWAHHGARSWPFRGGGG